MDTLFVLRDHSYWLYLFTILLGLSIGSFLNVIIHRLPRMMEQRWRQDCQQLFSDLPDTTPTTTTGPEQPPVKMETRYNLIVPRSHCPQCGHQIGFIENIPLLSFIWQRGRCRKCQQPISWRYPMVELVTALCSVAILWFFGLSWTAALALIFTWALIALSVIDLNHQLLPDDITLPLLWLGLAANLFGLFVPLIDAVIGAISGYLSLWLVYHGFKLLTGKEGLGFGDFKLVAAFGAWLGWQVLPLILLLASIAGVVINGSLILLRGRDRQQPIPFGPHLCAAAWISLLWGGAIITGYLRYFR